jgi:glycosyltransferase involved in cell wall biosynthesis
LVVYDLILKIINFLILLNNLGQFLINLVNIVSKIQNDFNVKILYIHQYFKIPEEGGALRSYYLGKELVDAGIEVELITTHNKPYKEIKEVEGIKVYYLPIIYDNNFSYSKRLWSFIKFVLLAIKTSYEINNVTCSYVMTTPLTTGFIALYNKWMRGIPYIFEVGDLWPEVPIQMGVIKNYFLKSILTYLEGLFYKESNGVIGQSISITDHISKRVKKKPIETITNIADCDFFKENKENKNLKEELGITNEFVVSYTGTIGIANHLEFLLEMAEMTKELPLIFLVIGNGSEKKKIEMAINRMKLDNVLLLPSTNREGVSRVLNLSDAVYLSFQNIDVLHTGSPNKLFDGLAAGKMIVSNLGGWTKDLIESNRVGIVYDPTTPDDFADKIIPFLNDRNMLKVYQKNARKLAENEFSLRQLANKQLKFIQHVILDS